MGQHEDTIAPFIAAIDEVRGERDRLREALAFYAAPATYEEGAPSPGFLDGEVPVERDRGQIARSALSPESNPEGQ